MLSIGLLLIWIPYGSDFVFAFAAALAVFLGLWSFLDLDLVPFLVLALVPFLALLVVY